MSSFFPRRGAILTLFLLGASGLLGGATGCSRIEAAGDRPGVVCHRAQAGGVTIDGDLREWAGASRVVIETDGQPAEVRLLWDDEFLYLAFTVTDGDLWSDAKPNPWETGRNDSVEFFFDALNDGGISPQSDDIQFRVDMHDLATGAPQSETNGGEVGTGAGWTGWGPADAAWAARPIGAFNDAVGPDIGFVYEIALDWDSIGAGAAPSGPAGTRGGQAPLPSSTAGFSVAIVDDDLGGNSEQRWTLEGIDTDNPFLYADLAFSDAPPSFEDIEFSSGETTIFDPSTGGAYYPRMTRLSTGDLLCAYDTNEGTGGPTEVRLHRSTNGGSSWSPLATVATSSNALANGFVAELENGRLLCAYREIGGGQFSLRVSKSDDGGETWQFLSTIHSNTIGVWEPWLEVLPNGVIVCAYANEEYQPDWPQVIEITFSQDGGATWGDPVIAAQHPSSRDGVPSLVQGPGHTLYCFFEAQDLPPIFSIRSVRSLDGGLTWIDRDLIHTPAAAEQVAAAPSAILLHDDRLLCGFYTDEDSESGNGEAFADVKFSESRDLGQSWRPPVLLHASDGADLWANFVQNEDGDLLGAYFTNHDGNDRLLLREAQFDSAGEGSNFVAY